MEILKEEEEEEDEDEVIAVGDPDSAQYRRMISTTGFIP